MISRKTGRILFSLVALGLAVILLYLALRQVSWAELIETVRQVQPVYFALGFFLTSLALLARALRWGILAGAQKPIRLSSMFWATAAGYLGNTVLPARAGELLRSVMLGKETHTSSSYVLATALTERIMDVIALVIIGAIASQGAAGQLPGWLPGALQGMAAAGCAGLVVFFAAPRFEPQLLALIRRAPLPAAWAEKINGLVSQFLLGTQALLNPRRAAGFVAATAVIWLLDGLSSVIFAGALAIPLRLDQALLLLAALGLSSALPSTPGYVGIYQFVAVTVMPVFGATPSQALAYILAGQAVNVLTVAVWGLIGMWRMGIKSLRRPE